MDVQNITDEIQRLDASTDIKIIFFQIYNKTNKNQSAEKIAILLACWENINNYIFKVLMASNPYVVFSAS